MTCSGGDAKFVKVADVVLGGAKHYREKKTLAKLIS